ncbi:prostaglandin reductase-3-like [Babylonia areolata]|uniref:prostaglandin reductase-3-like n=1 Tax=Babylonia areolata TaxID=304850 RepID=UPI003FCF84A4
MASQLPKTMGKIIVTQLGSNFSKVTKLIDAPVPQPGPGEVLVRNKYVGINASDVNFTSGRYDASTRPPFDAGFEGLGNITAVGQDTSFKVGQPVVYLCMGAFSEYKIVPATQVVPLPAVDPKFLPFMLSGLTAAISLDKVAEIKKGDKVLITAAAGGTGQFAVQWCKNAGCEVIGTCSTDDKVQFLKDLGCDRPINYKKEDLSKVLKAEYPNGVNVVYESVGGAVFETCLNNLAQGGRLMVIGAISGYLTDNSGFKSTSMLPLTMLRLSASLRGFFLMHFTSDYKEYMTKLVGLYQKEKITSTVDMGEKTPEGPFMGLKSVSTACGGVRVFVSYMYTSQNIGKIVVQLY